MTKEPPIGVMPKWIHDERRVEDLAAAIERRITERLEIPLEWFEEYNNLIKHQVKKRKSQNNTNQKEEIN
ncbi:hypothetical protein MHI11_14235 [Bacillus sp. FSL K6-3312]|uniref:hypothetical protein n=1 Tax=Bacillus sp. FSL K6-3312 TaxID=2921499 RepID=UPI0030FA6062